MEQADRDIAIKCTRCRHACMESEWLDVPSKRFGGCTEKTCPRCGCKSYYDTTRQVAWCWASGLVEIGDKPPPAAIVFAEGPKYALESVISVAARHGKGASDGKLLVPGIPEAEDQRAALNALDAWLDWNLKCNRGKRDGVVWIASRPDEGAAQ